MALVQNRPHLTQEVLGRKKFVWEEIKDGLSVRFWNDDPAARQDGTQFAFFRPSARKETQFVLKDQNRMRTSCGLASVKSCCSPMARAAPTPRHLRG